MKVKNVVIEMRSVKSVLHEAGQIMERLRKGEKVEPKFGVGFENVEAFRKVMTDKRMELLRVIKAKSPDSIYGLAKIVGRDLKSVNTDISVLKDMGLVSLEKEPNERRRVRPVVDFDKLNVEIALS